ncbi:MULTISPECIES: hypothetical protein [Nitrincola]|uniref:Uncharacterized protein n=1 Tax=Nitrincola nitratireducens TaxID=1229521 RepID=W9VE95_9GAMM|nr:MULTISPECIES: hypothetical protein [Nitrincola]EXJ09030.1 hypothetical protein D791_04045 [Nitrincola nitratireducens]
MGHYNYGNSLADSDIPDTLTKEQVMLLLDNVIKETFFELYEHAFGAPDDAITARVEEADLLTVKSWMINIVDAQTPSDLFVSPIERTVAKFAASVLNRKYGKNINIDDIRKPEDLYSLLKKESD